MEIILLSENNDSVCKLKMVLRMKNNGKGGG